MNIILLGPPGSGKGTQSKLIEDQTGVIQLSSGEILRKAVASGNELGNQAKQVMDVGDLMPDEIMIEIMAARMDEPDCRNGFILDGFPRTTGQARALDEMLQARGMRLDRVIEIQVDEDVMFERITGRFHCARCGEGYHDSLKRPKAEGVCDVCGSTEFERRTDDNADTVSSRIEAYREQTEQIIPYYRDAGILTEVDGMRNIDKVTQDIAGILSQG